MNLFCPSCNSNNVKYIGKIHPTNQFAGKTLDFPLLGGDLYKCRDCYLYFRWPQLTKAELDRLYKEGDSNNWQHGLKNRHDWQVAANWLNLKLSRGTVLDIGCLDGEFLEYLEKGWHRYGIEINEVAAQKAEERRINIIAKDFDQIDQLTKQFDAVTAFDVIEHVENPAHFLRQMARLTRTGGVMIISSGNTEARTWKFMGSKYWYCTIAEHISFINKKWCFAMSHALNLDIEHIESFSHSERKRVLLRVIVDLTKNILYKFSPGAVGILRTIGLGTKDIKRNKESKHQPPSWMYARDHFIVFFRKR